jgi:ribosomal-protein-alanine N-acetyltransferase
VTQCGSDTAIGIFQIRSLQREFEIAEWGFVLASEHWGSGMFLEGAQLLLGFAFDELGAHRLEARATIGNGRGNGALKKLGAVREGVLRKSFSKSGQALDQALWTILHDEWVHTKTVWGSAATH